MDLMKNLVFALICILLFTAIPAVSGAQPLWDQSHDNLVMVEFQKPNLATSADIGFLTMAYFASVRIALGKGISFVGEVPFANLSFDGFGSENGFGNIYLGVEETRKDFYGEFGIRIPTASENTTSNLVGLVSDLDRWEAWIEDTWTVTGGLNYRHIPEGAAGTRARLVVAGSIPTQGNEPEFFGIYALQLLYKNKGGEFSMGFNGRLWLTKRGSFAQRSTHQFGLAGSYTFGQFRPGLQFKVPLDEDLADLVDFTIGLTLAYVLEKPDAQ